MNLKKFQHNNNENEPIDGKFTEDAAGAADSANNNSADDSGEYRFTREDFQRPAWRDAGYTPQDESSLPPRFHIQEPKPEKEKKPRKGGGMSFTKVACLCLVCALLGGMAGGLTVRGLSPDDDSSLSSPEASTPLISESNPTPAGGVTNISSSSLSASEIYDLALQQVVGISTEITSTNYFGMPTSASVTGSGFIITEDGYILTNYHVIENAYVGGYDITVMLHDGTTYKASIVGFEDENDIAVLKIEADGLSAASIGNSDSLSVGDAIYAVGNPLGELAYTMTGGMVSATDRIISTYSQTTKTSTSINMFQIDAAVNEGNSGGPVYNNRGQVIGIVTAKYNSNGVEGLGFAIPINDAADIANELITNGYVTGKASMGIKGQTITDTAAQYYNMPQGAYVHSITEGSCAETAGLKVGDIITIMDDVEISSFEDLRTVVRSLGAGDTVEMEVWRSGEYISLTITFDEELPESGVSSETSPNQVPYQYDSGIVQGW